MVSLTPSNKAGDANISLEYGGISCWLVHVVLHIRKKNVERPKQLLGIQEILPELRVSL